MATHPQGAASPAGGSIVIDFHRIPGKSREWILGHVRAGQEVVAKEIVDAGFKQVGEEKIDGLKENYFLALREGGAGRRRKRSRSRLRVQPRRPADPVRHLLRLPRPRQGQAQGRPAARHRGRRGKARRRRPASPTRASWSAASPPTTPTKRMPPPKSGRKLTRRADRDAEARGSTQGAKWQTHWAFVAPQRPAVPDGQATRPGRATRSTASSSPGWSARGWRPSPEADRHTLHPPRDARPDRPAADAGGGRRLPRRPVARRLRDGSSTGCSRRRATASGWRCDWLDAARYADTNGYQSDRDRDHVAVARLGRSAPSTRNMPFDQFTVEQLAGDLLPGRDAASRRSPPASTATTCSTARAARIAEESRVEYVVDRVDTTATVWLGLTLGCARCHDHKYDPFTQKEYYQLFAYFNNVAETGGGRPRRQRQPRCCELPTPRAGAATLRPTLRRERSRQRRSETTASDQRRRDAPADARRRLRAKRARRRKRRDAAATAPKLEHGDRRRRWSWRSGRQPRDTLRAGPRRVRQARREGDARRAGAPAAAAGGRAARTGSALARWLVDAATTR